MKELEELRTKCRDLDEQIIRMLTERMEYVEEALSYKKEHKLAILDAQQEAAEKRAVKEMLADNKFAEEIADIFASIRKNSHKAEAKSLFDYNVFLIGFMGVGKSTIASNLQKKLSMNRVEMDQMIADGQGMSIPDIFAQFGEDYFRDLESKCLIDLQQIKQSIVSCGGGIVMRAENADHMRKNGRIVLLTAEPETILERVKDSKDRPILNDHMNVEFISELLEKRRAKYEATADICVATDHKNADEICNEIIEKLIAFDEKQTK